MAVMMLEMTSAGNPVVCGMREAHGSTSLKLWAVHEGTWTIR